MLPTNELYEPLIKAYRYFNSALFDDELPNVIFTLQRKKDVMGFFAAQRWGNTKGETCGEIAINPSYFANSRMIEVMQTLVHEMVHCWQFTYGKPSRGHYHNKQWADKMMSIGLMPSSTGEPGGSITGQSMGDFIIKDGKFMKHVTNLLNDEALELPWVDRFALPRLFEPIVVAATSKMEANKSIYSAAAEDFAMDIVKNANTKKTASVFSMPVSSLMPSAFFMTEVAKRQTRSKYECPGCNVKIYGKFGLNIICEDCDCKFALAIAT
jgi:predicted SprT family Zn-dependent metalloprotease